MMFDVRAFESLPIDIRLKKQWFGVFFPYLGIQFAVHGDVKYPCAMGALGFEFNGKLFPLRRPCTKGVAKASSAQAPYARSPVLNFKR